MFFVDLKQAPHNKDVFNVEYIQQCTIKFKLPKNKSDIAQCENCQRYGHTKTTVTSNRDAPNAQVTI
jgi:hypothetical protein